MDKPKVADIELEFQPDSAVPQQTHPDLLAELEGLFPGEAEQDQSEQQQSQDFSWEFATVTPSEPPSYPEQIETVAKQQPKEEVAVKPATAMTQPKEIIEPIGQQHPLPPKTTELKPSMHHTHHEKRTRPILLVLAVVAVIALLLFLGSLWVIVQLRAEIQSLQNNFAQLEVTVAEFEQSSRWQQLTEDVESLNERLGALAQKTPAVAQPLVKEEQTDNLVAEVALPAVEEPEKTADLDKPWAINLAAFPDEQQANDGLKPFHEKGIEAVVRQVKRGQKTWFRISVLGFASYREAKVYADQLQREHGLKQSWIGKITD